MPKLKLKDMDFICSMFLHALAYIGIFAGVCVLIRIFDEDYN